MTPVPDEDSALSDAAPAAPADATTPDPDSTVAAATPAPRVPLLVRGERLVAALLAVAVVAWAGWLAWHRPTDPVTVQRNEFPPPRPYHLLVDINNDSWRRMTLIPGLGEKTAKAIVADRDANGPFPDLDSLRRVRGVGPKSLERWRDFLVVGPAPDHAAADNANGAGD